LICYIFSNSSIICCSSLGASEKTYTAEKEKGKTPETPPLKRTRIKVLASKTRLFLHSNKSTSSKPLTSNPSGVCPMQTNLKGNGQNSESEQTREVQEEGSSQQVDLQAIKSERTNY
jgi:hypothetical protein